MLSPIAQLLGGCELRMDLDFNSAAELYCNRCLMLSAEDQKDRSTWRRELYEDTDSI